MANDVYARTNCELLVDIADVNVNPKKLKKLSQAKICQYLCDYERGDEFPPILVEDCGGFFTVRDGRHRYQAQLLAGYDKISVIVY